MAYQKKNSLRKEYEIGRKIKRLGMLSEKFVGGLEMSELNFFYPTRIRAINNRFN